jgi:hypothetical protein
MAPNTMIPANAHADIPGNPTTATSSSIRLREHADPASLKVLSAEDWAFWKHNGYVVVKKAVPLENAERLAALLWEFEEKDPNDPSTWYTPPRDVMKMKELVYSGMVEM